MSILEKCEKIFIDFDGVVVDSNHFKEKAIQKSRTLLASAIKGAGNVGD